jgi:hypothetical protein
MIRLGSDNFLPAAAIKNFAACKSEERSRKDLSSASAI